jgi:hypothetical protein
MSDYAQITDFSAKDALASGDPEKLILGSDVDDELAAISTAVASKYDSNDLASQAQAEAETSNVVLMTPLRLANWADYNAGIVGDLQALADPGADRVLGWDESANAAIAFTISTGLTTSGTSLLVDSSVIPTLAATQTFAGTISFSSGTTIFTNTLPIIRITQTGAAADEKNWLLYATGGDLLLATATDASPGAAASSYMTFTRSGTTPGTLTLAGAIDGDTTVANSVGFRGMPINSQSGGGTYTLVWADAGKYIYSTGSTNFSIPNAATTNFPLGTVFTFVANPTCTIAVAATDTLYLAGSGFATTGTRTLATGGIATAIKITSTGWLISGTGLS